jgi:PAS domain S-box-containing protein
VTFGIVALRTQAERERAQEALRHSEERYHMLFERMFDGFALHEIILDAQGEPCDYRFLEVNPAFEALTGLKREAIVGKTLCEAWPGVEEEWVRIYGRVAQSGGQVRFEPYFRPLDKHFEICAYRPQPGQFATIFTDITERKRAEQERARHRDHLEQLVRERTQALEAAQAELLRKQRLATLGQLIGTVSHEMANPLQTIAASLYNIRRGMPQEAGDAVRRAMRYAERNVERCDRIIEELRDFAHTRALEFEPTNLDLWLESVINDYPAPAGIAIKRDLATRAEVKIEQERLRRCVINILNNACHAIELNHQCDDKRITVSARASERGVDIQFTDTGTGIESEDLGQVFEPLFTTKSFGVGLGLPIVKQVMDAHAGGVEIVSQHGKGTTVTLWLPI